MLGLMLAAAAAAAAPLPPVIVEGSRGWISDRRVLRIAMAAPERARRPGETRFCFDDRLTHAGEVRRVCRARRDWNRLGLDPVATTPTMLAAN